MVSKLPTDLGVVEGRSSWEAVELSEPRRARLDGCRMVGGVMEFGLTLGVREPLEPTSGLGWPILQA